jgi:pSer/pThr/pTyr-binding forkhead associated (FHA) protein
MIIKSVGRSADCSFIILDPPRKVSRHHLDLIIDSNRIFIIDKSSNGTFVNGKKIRKDIRHEVKITDEIKLADSYLLDVRRVINLKDLDSELTRILPSSNPLEQGQVELNLGEKTIVLNADKTEIGEILSMDSSSFITIGRSESCDRRIDKPSISKNHCRIRLIDPRLIEIEDLNSTNGTFADGERLKPGERNRYKSDVQIKLGTDVTLNLSKLIPGIQVVQQPIKQTPPPPGQPNSPINGEEKRLFDELEDIWKEYQERQQKIANSGSGIAMGGMAASSLLAAVVSGPVGILIGVGGSLMARYMSQQKVSKLRNDFTYEDMFLQVYACPRCKESFQKKPWITIRECNKCRIKFR